MIDFQHIDLPTSPNYYYVAPADFSNIKPQAFSPIYPVSVETLKEIWVKWIAHEPRLEYIDHNHFQFQYIQRTRWLKFPDTIDVLFIEISTNQSSIQSSIAIFSRSQYGYYDFGVNRRRVQRWLKDINEAIDEAILQSHLGR